MPAPYSIDLRKRVIEEVENKKLSKNQISVLFKVDLKTIYNWEQEKKNNNTIEPKTGYQKGHSHKITDTDNFKKFIENNLNSSLQELSEKWGNISGATIRNMLRKIGYTRKKNNGVIKNVVKKSVMNI